MNQCSMWEADEQYEPEMVSRSAGRNSIVHVTLSETINNASPSTVNVLRSMQTPLTRGLFCLLRSSFGEVGRQHFFTLNNGKRLLWPFSWGLGLHRVACVILSQGCPTTEKVQPNPAHAQLCTFGQHLTYCKEM